MALSAETLPMIVSSLGLGIGLAYTLVGKGKHAAVDAMQHKIDTLKKLLDDADKDSEDARIHRKAIVAENAVLTARVAQLESQLGIHREPP